MIYEYRKIRFVYYSIVSSLFRIHFTALSLQLHSIPPLLTSVSLFICVWLLFLFFFFFSYYFYSVFVQEPTYISCILSLVVYYAKFVGNVKWTHSSTCRQCKTHHKYKENTNILLKYCTTIIHKKKNKIHFQAFFIWHYFYFTKPNWKKRKQKKWKKKKNFINSRYSQRFNTI